VELRVMGITGLL